MKKEQIVSVLDRHVEDYLNNIAIELEKSHDQWFDNFGFPIFGETSKESHEQLYFQSYLESYTRQMINGVLRELLEEEFYDEITWPEFEFKGIYNGYTNIESEREFGFEFIDRSTKVGYRYSFFHLDEIDGLLSKGNVDRIVLVIWENKDEIIGFSYDDERVKVILLCDLFHEFFYELGEEIINTMYDLFTSRIKAAVERANAMISLTTLPGFTPSYLFRSRNGIIDNLRKEVELLSCFSVNNPVYKYTEVNSKQLINTYQLPQYFLANKLEYAFVGTSDYAKSYLTSEYLYHYFKSNPMFDFTPIVSGYLKSIEQLLHAICASYFSANNIQRDFSDYTLSKYITDIRRERVFRKELVSAKSFVIGCLNSYRAESRNNLFHIDYLNSWDRVEQIRANTLFLYVVLLGSIDPALLKNDPSVLGILNIEYDRLFFVLEGQDTSCYSIEVDGKIHTGMRKEPRCKGLIFNSYGLIMNEITFTKFDYDHYETIIISRTNIPSEIWLTDLSGDKKRRVWPT